MPEPLPEEDALASYLEAGHLLRAIPGLAIDMVDHGEDDIIIGPPHVHHVRVNGFAVPAAVDVTALNIVE